MFRNLVVAAAVGCAAFAPAGPALAQSNRVPNGAYYGVYFPTTTIVAMAVRNNDIGATTIFTQNFNYPFTSGLPQSFFPGVTNLTLTNPGGAGKISSSGSWVLPNDSFGDFFQPDLCGQTRKGYMVASMTCSPNGITPGTNAMFSLRPTTLNIASGTYTGSVNSTPRDPASGSNPSTPWTGTTGSVTLNVGGGTISGSASLSPVNPQTGFPQAGPPVNVTYAPASMSSSPSVHHRRRLDGHGTLQPAVIARRLQPLRRVPDQRAGDRRQPMRHPERRPQHRELRREHVRAVEQQLVGNRTLGQSP
jgi:hypothetical protein